MGQSLGLRFWDLGFRVYELGCRVRGLGFRVGVGSEFGVYGLWFRVQSSGFWVFWGVGIKG